MINDQMRAFADRYLRLFEAMDETKADLKELDLEVKAYGLNVAELKKWAKAEHADKVAKLAAATADSVLYGNALGHDVGFSGNDQGNEKSLSLSDAKEAAE